MTHVNLATLNPYELHKHLINEYYLKKPGDTTKLKRDSKNDKTDLDVIYENHRFLWDSVDVPDTWEKQLAKRYYDKLFKEYCIADLSRYKENMVALRWRIEKEVIVGKGQFICGNKICSEKEDLRTWEVNFAYKEDGMKKNALIKLRLCPDCSNKLNYHSKKREIKRCKRRSKKLFIKDSQTEQSDIETPSTSVVIATEITEEIDDEPNSTEDAGHTGSDIIEKLEEDCWTKAPEMEDLKSREEEFDEYLENLLL